MHSGCWQKLHLEQGYIEFVITHRDIAHILLIISPPQIRCNSIVGQNHTMCMVRVCDDLPLHLHQLVNDRCWSMAVLFNPPRNDFCPVPANMCCQSIIGMTDLHLPGLLMACFERMQHWSDHHLDLKHVSFVCLCMMKHRHCRATRRAQVYIACVVRKLAYISSMRMAKLTPVAQPMCDLLADSSALLDDACKDGQKRLYFHNVAYV